jgi:hypothetical protein
MSVYVRRYLSDPGNAVLLDIESVNILDLTPPAQITGVGSGTVLIVGEFENGPFNTVTQVFGAQDFANTFGMLGYQYGSRTGQNPCARARYADGALVPEYWNGNGFVQLNAKQFAELLICRVDTSVGQVQFQRQAFLTGNAAFAYQLQPGQVFEADIGSGFMDATFTATAATRTSTSQTFPTTFAGGETLTLGYDGQPNFTVTFLASDQTQAAVIARINSYAGFAFAASVTGTTMSLTGRQLGNGGQVRIVGASAGGVLTALGLSVAQYAGTGNVANIAAVTFTEIKTVIQTAISGTVVEQDAQDRLRVSKMYASPGDYITIGPGTTATALGFLPYASNSNDGLGRLLSAGGTYPTTFAGGETLTLQVDANNPVTVTFTSGDQTQTAVISRINGALGYTAASAQTMTRILLTGQANGGKISIVAVSSALVTTATGFTPGTTVQSNPVLSGTLPAGTVVANTQGTANYVTMQDVTITAAPVNGVGGVGPYAVKVRPALDNGTATSSSAGTITSVPNAPVVASFSCVNLMAISAALTESQIDAQYAAALAPTLDVSTIARTINIIFSARQSNAIRRALHQNALTASATGCYGRMAVVRPPIGIPVATALSSAIEPGVGAYRDQRMIYTYPQVNTFVPQIAAVGLAGGAGFTADGNVNVGADGFLASIMSQLNPEDDPGQLTTYTTGINSLDTAPTSQGYTIDTYIAFKAAGICAPRMDDGTAIYQSGVTTVDPLVYPQLIDINRRRMADYIEDSLALQAKSYGKKLMTFARRQALANEQVAFLENLVSPTNPSSQRIDSYSVDRKSGNTADTLALGMYRLIINVRTLQSFKSIVLQSTIGSTVTINELTAA